ncbi:DNA repair and recombination protein RAD54B isoform X3 [Rousettus aegyptiacus]|uniref:DNA repair and recombination protein RAD54B isoform X3 n=1 Tax=Rousettus aegyptiacus TaxID=9407 RepID=UPI00168CCAB4|nr:DNA repair and recombination protein RAD54B isoform X3 [Rousettus aegyptiacus]
MRRSAAPSQLQGKHLKKPKFIPPGRSNLSSNEEITKLNPDIELFEVAANDTLLQSQTNPRTCSLNLLSAEESGGEINHGDNYKEKYCFEAPAMATLDLHHTVHSSPKEITVSKGQRVEPDSIVKYFNVIWRKASKKKHKKWEGDAVLIVKGKSFTLKDLEGKDIGRGTGYKFKDLEKIEEGQTMMFAGKEIEVMDIISPDDFSSGKCFQLGGENPAISSSSQAANRCFLNPLKSVRKPTSKENTQSIFQNCKPRHDPYLPNSLVMLRPDNNHQRMFNKNCFPVVDVVIDPHLVYHLRAHQKEGIIFLYECVMGMSYEMLLRSLDQIKNIKFDLLICDEGHRLKNSTIKTTTALISLSCEKRIILTGTPVQNDLQEFFALIDFVNPGILGSLSSYRKIYEEPIIISRQPSASEEEKELGERRAAELTCLTGLFFLRRTQEVINKYLPPKIENVVFCRPGALQIELYRKLLNSQSVRFCLEGLLENSPHLICIGALKKLCNHPCLLFNSVKEKECSSTWDENEEKSLYEGLINVFPADYNPLLFTEKESGKLQVLTELLAVIHELRPTQKVVLVSNYTQTLNILQEVCKRHGYTYTRLDGQTPISQRQQIVDVFNSKYSSDFIFLLSSKAGGVGLNLIGGSHLILYDIDWNPATDIQAMSRVWRDGQKHPVHIYRLLTTGTIEEKIYQRQISKQGLSGAVVDLTRTSEHMQFSVEELKNLFTLHESSHCITHDLLNCDCTGEQDHTGDSLEKFPVSRNCQLGPHHQKFNSLKPLSMSQLKQWQHFSGDHLNLTDPFLKRIRENVSFFFQNITNQTTAP